ncbi:ATP-binding cassette sub-family C member 12-like [Alosa pseudoharengus]|uniref:ATP-binding cassette sub-family C member 12-like n=1 Tax=Alosa pseudoharengus TaxID=34774 RepID=UPI003F8BE96A
MRAGIGELQATLREQRSYSTPERPIPRCTSTPAPETSSLQMSPLALSVTLNDSIQVPSQHADVTLRDVGPEDHAKIHQQRYGQVPVGRYGCLLFRSIVTEEHYKAWSKTTNWDGAKGKRALPQNKWCRFSDYWPSVGNRWTRPPQPERHCYHHGLQNMFPFCMPSGSHPLDNAGFFSFASFSWMTPVMWRIFRNRLDQSSLIISPHDGARTNGDRMERLWQEEVSRVGLKKASLGRVMLRFQRTRLILSVLSSFLLTGALFLGPAVLVYEILSYVDTPGQYSLSYGLGMCFALFSSEVCRTFLYSLTWAISLRTATRVKGAFSMLAFRKIINMRIITGVSVGQIINVLTVDSYRMFEAVVYGSYMLSGVLLALLLCISYSCYILGYTALIGISVYLGFIPIQFCAAKVINVFRRRAVVVTDSRVHTMNEVLTCIKLIKMYAWEESFEKKITEIRMKERSLLQKAGYVQSMNTANTAIVPTIATILTFIVHTLLGLPLDPSTAFTIMAVFNTMNFYLAFMPYFIKCLAEGIVSLSRLKKLLLLQNPESYLTQKKGLGAALVMENASFCWKSPDHSPENTNNETHTSENKLTLRNISFTLPKGNLLGVCGNVGSGKTSLISSVLEQMHLVKGSVIADGTFAYVSQQAWIFHGSVRDNILMGQPFNQQRYNDVINVCSLKPDLAILYYGDETESDIKAGDGCEVMTVARRGRRWPSTGPALARQRAEMLSALPTGHKSGM